MAFGILSRTRDAPARLWRAGGLAVLFARFPAWQTAFARSVPVREAARPRPCRSDRPVAALRSRAGSGSTLAPLVRHPLKERRIDEPVEFIDVHGVNALIEPLVFGLMALDRFRALAPLVGVAGVQRLAHPFRAHCRRTSAVREAR
jgi:hypothetical protein